MRREATFVAGAQCSGVRRLRWLVRAGETRASKSPGLAHCRRHRRSRREGARPPVDREGCRLHVREQSRQQGRGVQRDAGRPGCGEVIGRQFLLRDVTQQIDDALSAIGLGYSRPTSGAPPAPDGRLFAVTMMCDGGSEVWQITKRNESGPLGVARPAIGRMRTIAGCPNGNVTRRIVANVAFTSANTKFCDGVTHCESAVVKSSQLCASFSRMNAATVMSSSVECGPPEMPAVRERAAGESFSTRRCWR